MQSKVIGVFEKVNFPEFGIESIKAKIDSGAYTGALHCTKIKEVSENGSKLLHFSPFDYPDTEIITEKYKVNHVKSSNGKKEKRYFIKTLICVQGEIYPIQLSLADRSSMKIPVIIGRKFLRKNKFLVDANLSILSLGTRNGE